MNSVMSLSGRMLLRSSKQQLRCLHSVTISKLGSPGEVLTLNDVDNDSGKVGANQVKVKMLAASITYQDILNIQGKGEKLDVSKPIVAGARGVGVVEEVGGKVSNVKAGDHVISASGAGAWAKTSVVNSSGLIPVPKDIPAEQLSSVAYDAAIALDIISKNNVKSGDVIIHNYANGPLGLPLVQIAKSKGAKVISVLTKAVDYQKVADSLKAAGSDVVIDEHFLGSEAFKAITAEHPPTLAVTFTNGANAESLSAISSSLASGAKTVNAEELNLSAEALPEVSSLLKSGELKQNTSVVDFSEFSSALTLAETMSVNGSLVLKM